MSVHFVEEKLSHTHPSPNNSISFFNVFQPVKWDMSINNRHLVCQAFCAVVIVSVLILKQIPSESIFNMSVPLCSVNSIFILKLSPSNVANRIQPQKLK